MEHHYFLAKITYFYGPCPSLQSVTNNQRYNVGPPSYKLVYKAHEYYSYLRIINHSYWSHVHQLSCRKRGPTLYG
jgi:hypothetical protein